jgi:alcohol dehydrogenase class IV
MVSDAPVSFEFATAAQILFGPGRFAELGERAAAFGKRALLAANRSQVDRFRDALEGSGITCTVIIVQGEPTVADAETAVELAREAACELVVGAGGGSAIDLAKAAAALLPNPGETLDYLEVVGRGKPLTEPSLPCIAVPTTAGTGSEVTRNAVLGVPEQRVKVSLRSATMLPRLALVDPDLTCSLPPAVTASSGLDALTQLIEPFVSRNANPLTDALCREGIPRAARSLRRAFENGNDRQARQDMSLAALLGGLALANAKLGAVHGIAGPFGGMAEAPHGAVCARLLPFVVEANLNALERRDGSSVVRQRFDELARMLTGDPEADARQGIDWLRALITDLQIPPLGTYGMDPADLPVLIEKSMRSSSMRGNPVELSAEELRTLIQRAW